MTASPAGEPDDGEAIARVLAGDSDAFAYLVRRHSGRVFRLGLSFFRDATESEDFVQDVFLKAYTGLAGFRGQSSFSTWLLRVAYNTAVNAKRRARESSLPVPEDELPGSPGTDEEHERLEDMRAVRAAIGALPPNQALCVELFFFEDLRHAEISEITGLPVNTIKSHVHRAKRALRARLGEP